MSRNKKILYTIAIVIVLIWTLFPIGWMILTSLKSPTDVYAYPPKIIFKPILDNWVNVLLGKEWTGTAYMTVHTDIPRYFMNSFLIASGATLIAFLLGLPAAYSLARYKFFGKENFAFTLLSFRFAPGLIVIFGIYQIYQRAGLFDTLFGVMAVHQLLLLPFVVWMMRSYIAAIPVDIERAARVDGYSWLGVFTKVTLPLIKPALAASAVIAFIYSWNEFLLGYVVTGPNARPMTPALLGFISYERVLWGQMAAASVLGMLPSIVLSLFVQRYVVAGLSFGAVKG